MPESHQPADLQPATLERLAILDPELTETLRRRLGEKKCPLSAVEMHSMEDDVLQAMGQDIDLGVVMAYGYAELLGEVPPERVAQYTESIRTACEKGLNLGRIMASAWVPVLKSDDPEIRRRFPELAEIMRRKGEYTLKKPLSVLGQMLREQHVGGALAFMGLLFDLFSQDLPYKDSLQFARVVPPLIQSLSPEKRGWQISRIRRVARADFRLVDPFLKALEKDLHLLDEAGLARFVAEGLSRFEKDETLGMRFFGLESRMGVAMFQELRVAVSLGRVRGGLDRYLRARTGLGLTVAPLTTLPASLRPDVSGDVIAVSDGRRIYLPETVSRHHDAAANATLYKVLAKLESAYYEFGTFDVDLERVAERCPGLFPVAGPEHDLERFFKSFPVPESARALWETFEQGRLRKRLQSRYPGIWRDAGPVLVAELARRHPSPAGWASLYRRTALGVPPDAESRREPVVEVLAARFERRITPDATAEDVAVLVWEIWIRESRDEATGDSLGDPAAFTPPFGRVVRPDLYLYSFGAFDRQARRLREKLAENGVRAYVGDIRKRLVENRGTLTEKELAAIALTRDGAHPPDVILSGINWQDIPEMTRAGNTERAAPEDLAFWYPEWDCGLGDYLDAHARVIERLAPEGGGDLYDRILSRRYGLVRTMRRAFERLKPEALTLLRCWVEGDDFDYRAMLDFAVDRRAGLMPSDRLYIKRLKRHRDVAVMLLVDLSRSTANPVFESDSTVLDLEKEALVLFCEALQVVGDDFALAGFSGSGRMAVDFLRIKDFDEPLSDAVKRRISGMHPLRSTRMGAAIRHAAARIETVPAKVRLLIILGDGFPNDTGYKREYAIADTRKAIAEARSRGIHARAITVNIVGDDRLDALYGSFHHNVISDVRHLPDKLLRIYSALTR